MWVVVVVAGACVVCKLFVLCLVVVDVVVVDCRLDPAAVAHCLQRFTAAEANILTENERDRR